MLPYICGKIYKAFSENSIAQFGGINYIMMENKLLLNLIEDRYAKFQTSYSMVTTDFLDLAQQSAVNHFVRGHAKDGIFLYGGHEDAERKQIVFAPDYLGVTTEEELIEHFVQNPEDCPLAVLDVKVGQKGATLKHSDYLGSLLSLGIKREKTGDIIVQQDGAQIFVAKEIAPYLAENYFKAGRVPLTVKILPIAQLVVAKADIEQLKLVVSSVRLDNVVGAVFGLSRKLATEAITKGLVFVDSVETKKPDYFLKGGEKIVLRGKGKAVYNGTSGTSRKGKIYTNFERYI